MDVAGRGGFSADARGRLSPLPGDAAFLVGPGAIAAAMADWLARRRKVASADLARARNRQRVYGGALDTALFELSLAGEATVREALAAATGIPVAEPAWLREIASFGDAAARFGDAALARRRRAQAVAQHRGRLELVVTSEVDLEAVAAAIPHRGGCRFLLAPELDFETLVARVHEIPLPHRFLKLLGRRGDLRAAGVVAWPERRRTRTVPAPPVETGPTVVTPPPEPVIDVSEDVPEEPPTLDVREATPAPEPLDRTPTAVHAALDDLTEDVTEVLAEAPPPPGENLEGAPSPQTQDWRAEVERGGPGTADAIGALVALRDREIIPRLIELIEADDAGVADAAVAGLETLTAQGFGRSRWRWVFWWRLWGKKHRVEWLLEALRAPEPERRLAAAQELERVSGLYVGYHFDLGRREREAARRRWQRWWEEQARR